MRENCSDLFALQGEPDDVSVGDAKTWPDGGHDGGGERIPHDAACQPDTQITNVSNYVTLCCYGNSRPYVTLLIQKVAMVMVYVAIVTV